VAKNLTPFEALEGLENLKRNMEEMEFDKWGRIPLVICKEYNANLSTGMLEIPHNFNVDDFLVFFNEKGRDLINKRKKLEVKAKKISILEVIL
jgi:hypothetical protein